VTLQLIPRSEVAFILSELKRSGHPDALRLTAEITELTGVRSRSALRTPRRLQKKRLCGVPYRRRRSGAG
jgi:hypothetical protein